MKKLRPVFLAVLVGCSFAFLLFKRVESRAEEEPTEDFNATAIQIGVFKDPDNAEKMKETYGGKVFKDEDVYRVYYAILQNDKNLQFMTEYLDNLGINYYLKGIKVNDDVSIKGEEYEILMKDTSSDTKLSINDKLLSIYKEVV